MNPNRKSNAGKNVRLKGLIKKLRQMKVASKEIYTRTNWNEKTEKIVKPTSRKIRDAFNKLPDFFVLVFHIVVDSWKFGMLLLNIL